MLTAPEEHFRQEETMSTHRQITHDNHTVPQFYLRKWSNNGNTVNCYHVVRHNEGQRKWTSAKIKSMSVWRDLYTQTNDGKDDDSIERFFQRCEERAAKAIDNLIANGEVGESEMADLVDFAIAQMVRTPKWLAEQNDVIAGLFPSTTEEIYGELFDKVGHSTPTMQTTSKDLNNVVAEGATPFPPPPLEITIDEERNRLISELPIGQRSALYAMGRVLKGNVAKVLRSYTWNLLRFPNGLELPTSDNPFTRLKRVSANTYTTDCGVGVKGALLFMPLTPNWLLATEVGIGKVEQSRLEDQAVCALIFRAIVENAHHYVYSKRRDDTIELIRRSVVNKEYLQEYEEAKKNWLGT